MGDRGWGVGSRPSPAGLVPPVTAQAYDLLSTIYHLPSTIYQPPSSDDPASRPDSSGPSVVSHDLVRAMACPARGKVRLDARRHGFHALRHGRRTTAAVLRVQRCD